MLASLALAVVPHHTTNEYADNGVTHAATEVIDGKEYAVLNVYNNTSKETITDFMTTNNYIKFILKENLVCNEPSGTDPYVGPASSWSDRGSGVGKDVILDFNGYILTVQSPVAIFEILAGHIKIYDSSAAGTGGVKGFLSIYNRKGNNVNVDIYGGTFEKLCLRVSSGATLPSTEFVCKVHGGVVNHLVTTDADTGEDISLNTQLMVYGGRVGKVQAGVAMPPYLDVTHDVDGNITAVTAYDQYAVSTTDQVSGAYNYAYGYAWELTAAELNDLVVPGDKIYYLWGRYKNEWYEYLDVRYVNGVLV